MNRFTALSVLSLLTACRFLSANDKPAIDDLLADGQRGDAKAQLSLAVRYRDGVGVEKDAVQAIRWAHQAADQGDAAAMDFVGYAYLSGRGVKRNPAVAAGYFRAGSGSHARAAFNLGQCYFGAQGVEQDIPKALEAWKKAAEMGEGRAAAEAAMVYLSGEGVPADRAEAMRLASRAAELKDVSGLVVLGELQFQDGKIDLARETWRQASKFKPVGETGLPTQPNDNMSAQEAADLIRLIDWRKRKSEAGVFAYIESPHLHQGYNNCGATSSATLARFQGAKAGGWDFKKLCKTPVGTGTDWAELIAAAGKIGLKWKLVTFDPDDAGFEKGTTFLKSELDAGRPVTIDFRYEGPHYPGGAAGHTLNVVGYISAEKLWILRNPAIASPGLELMTSRDLELYWRSIGYSHLSKGKMSRPAIAIDSGVDK